jgi:hypothetical protein
MAKQMWAWITFQESRQVSVLNCGSVGGKRMDLSAPVLRQEERIAP